MDRNFFYRQYGWKTSCMHRMFFVLGLVVLLEPLPAQNSFPSCSGSVPPVVLFNAFKQGDSYDNCSAIAVIKAAIGTFGTNNIFRSEQKEDSMFVFTLRNHKAVALSAAELNFCISRSGFVSAATDSLADRIRKLADTCFALMCKQQQWKAQMPLEIAVRKLNSGYKTPEIASLLGLRFIPAGTVRFKKLSQLQHLVIYNYYHAAYSSGGLYDYTRGSSGYGKIQHFRWNHTGTDDRYNAFLCEIREALQLDDE